MSTITSKRLDELTDEYVHYRRRPRQGGFQKQYKLTHAINEQLDLMDVSGKLEIRESYIDPKLIVYFCKFQLKKPEWFAAELEVKGWNRHDEERHRKVERFDLEYSQQSIQATWRLANARDLSVAIVELRLLTQWEPTGQQITYWIVHLPLADIKKHRAREQQEKKQNPWCDWPTLEKTAYWYLMDEYQRNKRRLIRKPMSDEEDEEEEFLNDAQSEEEEAAEEEEESKAQQ